MDASSIAQNILNPEPSDGPSHGLLDEYVRLQLSLFKTTLLTTAFAFVISVVFFDFQASISFLVGALSGILYLRLLARSVGKIGENSKNLGKVQLLVPVLLVLSVSKLPQLELLPALLGFLLYKPAIIFQVLFESRTGSKI